MQAHGKYLAEHRGTKMLIQGNCDERGSRDIAGGNQARVALAHQGGGLRARQFVERAFGHDISVAGVLGHDVQENDRHTCIGKMGCDVRAHHAGADDGGFFDDQAGLSLPAPPRALRV